MPVPAPPHIASSIEHLKASWESVQGQKPDWTKAAWPEIEQGVIKLLKGAFQPNTPEHQIVAMGLAGLFAERLAEEHRAFWFPNRESIEGALLGFPQALMVLSPFGAVAESLVKGNLGRLDELTTQIRRSLAEVRFAPTAKGPQASLTPDLYVRLFDPGFVQFVAMDPKRLQETFDATPEKLSRDLRDALSRAGGKVPPEIKADLEEQLVRTVERLEPGKKLGDQAERANRMAELLAHLFATETATGAAPEELWQEVAFPLLFIGAPAQLPPLDPDDLEAVKAGADPLLLFLDLVPYQSPAAEDGLLGAFDVAEIGLPHPALAKAGSVHLVQVKPDRLRPILAQFDPQKLGDAIGRFSEHAGRLAGKAPQTTEEGKRLLASTSALLKSLKDVVEQAQAKGLVVCVRRLTEAHATSELPLAAVRDALRTPKIILA